MVEALVTLFVSACLLLVGCALAYAATHETLPARLKERYRLFRTTYDTPDEAARAVPLVVGVVVAMFGLAALFVGVAMLAGAVRNS